MTAFHLMTIALLLSVLNWFVMYHCYRKKCEENEFLTKLIDINTNVFIDVLKSVQKGNKNANN